MSEKNDKYCDCCCGCDDCKDFDVCACHGLRCEGPYLGILVSKKKEAPKYSQSAKVASDSQTPLQMACPPRYRRFVENIFQLVE